MKAKYRYIFETYKQKIVEGNRLETWKLPSESELMKEFKVSRQTVRRAISELARNGFVESHQGSGVFTLAEKITRLKIAFITFTLDTYIFPEIIRGISDELYLKNSDLLLFHSDYDLEKERIILSSLENVDGIIITPCYSVDGSTNERLLTEIRENGIPVVLLDNYFPDSYDSRFSIVSIDDFKGGFLAAEKLYTSGHRKIAIIYGKEHFGMIRRVEGASYYLKKQGLAGGNEFFTFDCSLQTPGMDIESLLNKVLKNKVTGIFCTNDQIALEIITEAEKRKIKIPDDISIIGFDDHIGNTIPLTTFSHPKKLSGEIAAQITASFIKNGVTDTKILSTLEPRLISRSTVKNI